MKLSQLKIDPEFQSKIPPLQFEEEQQLEQNIIAEGRLLNPIITWNDYILDGHTRYRILKKHGFTSHAKHRWKIGTKVFHQMAKALLTDGLLSVFPAADACSAEGLDHNPHMTPSEAEKRNRSLGSKNPF